MIRYGKALRACKRNATPVFLQKIVVALRPNSKHGQRLADCAIFLSQDCDRLLQDIVGRLDNVIIGEEAKVGITYDMALVAFKEDGD
eukprot:11192834-Lingulodinium_polyedra.AAC.1